MGMATLDETWDVINERKIEIERQLRFIKKAIESKSNEIAFLENDGANSNSIELFDRGLIKTLSASSYLLLYNLVECAMTNAIDAIHRHIRNERTSFHDLTVNMQKIALKNFKNALAQEDHIIAQSSIEHAIVWLGYDGEKIFSGNIDAKKIREMASKYGFDISPEAIEKSQGGRSLLMIKNKRNELAHGKVSFEECGQDTSIDELYRIFEHSIIFVEAILHAVSNYLDCKKYLKTS